MGKLPSFMKKLTEFLKDYKLPFSDASPKSYTKEGGKQTSVPSPFLYKTIAKPHLIYKIKSYLFIMARKMCSACLTERKPNCSI